MSKFCPIAERTVLYLDCLECEDKALCQSKSAPIVPKPVSLMEFALHPSYTEYLRDERMKDMKTYLIDWDCPLDKASMNNLPYGVTSSLSSESLAKLLQKAYSTTVLSLRKVPLSTVNRCEVSTWNQEGDKITLYSEPDYNG